MWGFWVTELTPGRCPTVPSAQLAPAQGRSSETFQNHLRLFSCPARWVVGWTFPPKGISHTKTFQRGPSAPRQAQPQVSLSDKWAGGDVSPVRVREPPANGAGAEGQASLGAGKPGLRGLSVIRNRATDENVLCPCGGDSRRSNWNEQGTWKRQRKALEYGS